MYRRVVLSSEKKTSGVVVVVYTVKGAHLLSQYRVTTVDYDNAFTPTTEYSAAVFAGSVRLQTTSAIEPDRDYEFILDVPENQPAKEVVREITSNNVSIAVYNENGVLVFRNTPKASSNSAPAQTVVPGETTSETIDEE